MGFGGTITLGAVERGSHVCLKGIFTFKGSIPNAHRAALVNIGDLAAYDYGKHHLKRQFAMKDGLLLHTLSAFVAGLVGAVLCTPADLIKTRLMNQPLGPDGKYVFFYFYTSFGT